MERRELYEPEDIEQLLIERPYDELLEMERAFVLRHLSGREEYETMRALLLRVHDDDSNAEPIDAEPSVRAHVMDVFRAEQRPQWRIWLNIVHAFLLPKEASEMWRPALALGSVALVVFFIVNRSTTLNETHASQLAEVKQVPEPSAEAQNQKAPAPPADQPATGAEEPAAQVGTVTSGVTRSETAATDAVDDEPVTVHDLQASLVTRQEAEQPAPPPVSENLLDLEKAENTAAARSDMEIKAVAASGTAALALDSTAVAGGTVTHVVTGNELTYNFSAANATPLQTVETVSAHSATRFIEREKAKKSEDRKRTVAAWSDGDAEATADAGAYVDLLRAAW